MNLLLLARKQEIEDRTQEEPGSFRILVDGELPTCCAGLNGQKNCKYYIKGYEPIPGYRYCGWFGRDDHSCMLPDKKCRPR